jgi:hypothetical protein
MAVKVAKIANLFRIPPDRPRGPKRQSWIALRNSVRTGEGAAKPSLSLEAVAAVGPPVFLAGLLALLSVLAGAILRAGSVKPGGAVPVGTAPPECVWLLGAAVVAVSVAWTFSWFTDINVFSLHALYANRLTRCYLGASRRRGSWGNDPERAGRMQKADCFDRATGKQLTGASRWF